MLQEVNGTIQEMAAVNNAEALNATFTQLGSNSASSAQANCLTTTSGCYNTWNGQPYGSYYWGSYPIYVTTDKTAKSIEILKKLEAKKYITLGSVKDFIKLVEEISAIL